MLAFKTSIIFGLATAARADIVAGTCTLYNTLITQDPPVRDFYYGLCSATFTPPEGGTQGVSRGCKSSNVCVGDNHYCEIDTNNPAQKLAAKCW